MVEIAESDQQGLSAGSSWWWDLPFSERRNAAGKRRCSWQLQVIHLLVYMNMTSQCTFPRKHIKLKWWDKPQSIVRARSGEPRSAPSAPFSTRLEAVVVYGHHADRSCRVRLAMSSRRPSAGLRKISPFPSSTAPSHHLGPIVTERPAGAFCLGRSAFEPVSQRCPRA